MYNVLHSCRFDVETLGSRDVDAGRFLVSSIPLVPAGYWHVERIVIFLTWKSSQQFVTNSI